MGDEKPKPVLTAHTFGEMRHSPEQIRDLFREGKYSYQTKIRGKAYERHKEELQVELLKVQNWVKLTGQRIIVICEGRDAAGKGGTIKRFMEHLNPRAARTVALEKPTEHERGQWYFQRYIKHLPSACWCAPASDCSSTGFRSRRKNRYGASTPASMRTLLHAGTTVL